MTQVLASRQLGIDLRLHDLCVVKPRQARNVAGWDRLQNGRGKECLQRAASLNVRTTDGEASDEMRELGTVSRGQV